ncbi:hypothetical protein ACFYOT_41400 [Saccharothrix saharensis]|uniref:hypothetical protein n=1 Tax=Saccharothrix saharensis TaxID=571190 RepID=UPI0036C00C7A
MWRKLANTIAVLALTAAGAVSPTPAAAAEPCRAGGLCLYYLTDFVAMKFVTERRGQCWELVDYGLQDVVGNEGVFSYRNNMAVHARFYDRNWYNVWNIRPGGSSSDSSSFHYEWHVCTD